MCSIWPRQDPQDEVSKHRQKNLVLALAAAGSFLSSAAALGPSAHAKGAAGILTSNASSGFGFVFGSSRELNASTRRLESATSAISTNRVSISALPAPP